MGRKFHWNKRRGSSFPDTCRLRFCSGPCSGLRRNLTRTAAITPSPKSRLENANGRPMEIRNRQDFSTTRSKTRHEFSLLSEIMKNLKKLDETVSCRSHQSNSIAQANAHSYRNSIDRDYELDRNWSSDPFAQPCELLQHNLREFASKLTLVKSSREDTSQTGFQYLRNLAFANSITTTFELPQSQTSRLQFSANPSRFDSVRRRPSGLALRPHESSRPSDPRPI